MRIKTDIKAGYSFDTEAVQSVVMDLPQAKRETTSESEVRPLLHMKTGQLVAAILE